MSRMIPALNAFATRHYSFIFQQHKAAIALAERLYQLDHGRGAQRLEDLVPDYLPTIPRDPMAGGNAAMPFVPTTQPAAGR
ncbi:MAG TPA: hypothetical protein VHP11_02300, partial [Tepidisphaeraceae bacterium]|nr:hypothetical protein [Tepidisphaeraceae bacterium]